LMDLLNDGQSKAWQNEVHDNNEAITRTNGLPGCFLIHKYVG
jgi:hypothetical protein